MKKERFETFTDGVIAILITLMVLEIHLPDLSAANFWLLARHIGVYALSFVVIAITWLNHHNMFQPVERINVRIIWLNFASLFFLSLVPLATQPLAEQFYRKESHMFYGAVLAGVCITYALLQQAVDQTLDGVADRDKRRVNTLNWMSALLYALSVPLCWVSIYLSTAIFILFPVLYFIPLRRVTSVAK